MKRRSKGKFKVVGVVLAGLIILSCTGLAIAQKKYPTDTIAVTVAYKAGGSTDAAVRMILPYLEKELKTSMYVKNLPGAGGEIGFTGLATSKPDGYTIGMINLPAVNLVAAARETRYEPIVEHFAPIGVNISDPNTIMVRKDDSRFNTIKDLIDYAKAHPGEIILGADGPLSDDQLSMYKIEEAMGVKFTYIPYAGGAPAAKALIGGETDVLISNCFDAIKWEENTKALAVLWPERYELIPHVPTFKEETGVEVVGGSTRGFSAPAGTPPEILARLRLAFYEVTTNPEYIKEAKKRGLTLIEPKIGDDFGKVIRKEEEAISTLLKYFIEGGYIKK